MYNGTNKIISTGAGIAVIASTFLVALIVILFAVKATEKLYQKILSTSQNQTAISGKELINRETGGQGQGCLKSGGSLTRGICCKMTGDFPNSCAIGACGCSPMASHEVKICECGEGKCFDGNSCVTSKF